MRKYETEIRVIYADTDAMGIVYHTNYIKWFEAGRNEYLRQIGYPYSRLEEEGVWLPVAAVNCEYKAPARYDDILLIQTGVAEMKAATVIIKYEIYNKETGELLVTGNSKHAITDPQLKPIRLKKVNPDLFERIMSDI
ncbi:acyl-CoA thioesterase [Clostridium aminobutyricum]|uniref:Acyl-CoA thioesterase n=1 Tax=Clostridium aminobutyricum TaxID=33953 RepID=A0A939D974_CLOAM|nr:thioesterase family protein [Clostridium aminobutyricum]MBN7773521.1 acyl-CoA thioesterase [Clostridium aminobutyricum]